MISQLRTLSVMDVVTSSAVSLRAVSPSRILLLTVLLLLTQCCHLEACEFGAPISGPTECVTFKPEDLDDITVTYQLENQENLYYRYLLLHKNYLLVGAKNYLFTLNKRNISREIGRLHTPSNGNADNCQAWGLKVDPDCQNHIHFITRNLSYPQSDVVYVCGTGSYNPTGFLYNLTSRMKVEDEYNTFPGNAKAICPFDPFDNTTAIYVAHRNPGNMPALYSAANVDYTKAGPLIYRGRMYHPNGTLAYDYLKTASKDSKMLNEPQFVGSFEMEDVVYFFFREEALEHSHSCGKKIYSRVARVCKNDKGGPNVVKNQWTSYQKARLNCSIPGKMQYYFDEIQDIQWDDRSKTFYALFTTSSYGVTGSAICVYTREMIEAAFSGPFQQQDGTQVPDSDVPSPRPGRCADLLDSTQVTRAFVTFVRDTPLMYYSVQHKFGEPIFMKPNVMLQKLQAHFFQSDNLFFAGANDGQVYQIYQPTSNLSETLISAVISPLKGSGPVWSLQYDSSTEMLYIGYDKTVVQFAMRRLCEKYTKADSCVFNRFCGWYNGECLDADRSESTMLITYCQLAQKAKSDPPKDVKSVWENLLHIFLNSSKPAEKHINQGGLVTLDIRMPLCTTGVVSWQFGSHCNQLQKIPRNIHILGADNSLTIRNASLSHQGCYSARDENEQDLAFYMLTVQTDDTEKEDLWTRKFYEWCDEFEDYKNRINVWKNSCNGDHSNTISQVPGG